MTTLELYRKHRAGEIGRDRFLYEVRRDSKLPWVTNVTSYDDAVKILKNKGIISEAEISENFEVHFSDGIRQSKKFKDLESAKAFAKNLINKDKEDKKLQFVDIFKAGPKFNSTADTDAVVAWWGNGSFMDNKSKKDPKLAAKQMSLNEVDKNVVTDPAVDRVNPYFLKKGVEKLLSKEEELTNDSYIKALNKAAKQLEKNPHAFDEDMFANAKDVEKADAKLERQEVKKNNHKDKANEMKKVKVKALKEAALNALTDSLKKKDQINEDSHWKYHIGSEVQTPDGPGKVTEIIGSTFTVEMEDGSLRDYQTNTIDHHTEKAQQEEAMLPFKDKSLPGSDGPLLRGYQMNKDGQRAISPEGLEFKVGDEAITVDRNEKIKIDSLKIQQRRIMAGYFDGMNYNYVDIAGLEKPAGDSPWSTWKGRPFGEAIKKYIAKHKGDKEKINKIKEIVKKLKEAGEKTALVTTTSGQTTAIDYKTDDELRSLGDNSDVKALKTGAGRKIKGN